MQTANTQSTRSRILHIYVYIYIYMYRERERERDRYSPWTQACTLPLRGTGDGGAAPPQRPLSVSDLHSLCYVISYIIVLHIVVLLLVDITLLSLLLLRIVALCPMSVRFENICPEQRMRCTTWSCVCALAPTAPLITRDARLPKSWLFVCPSLNYPEETPNPRRDSEKKGR